MKILFLLLAIANAVLFMWEYRSGALAPTRETPAQETSYQEQILLVRELKTVLPAVVQQPQNPVTVEQEPVVDKTEEN